MGVIQVGVLMMRIHEHRTFVMPKLLVKSFDKRVGRVCSQARAEVLPLVLKAPILVKDVMGELEAHALIRSVTLVERDCRCRGFKINEMQRPLEC